jgi:putative lipoprotein
MKNFIIFAVLATLLGGCGILSPAKSDKEFKFYDGNKTVIYKFAGEDLYENGRSLGVYSMDRSEFRMLVLDEAGKSYGNNYKSALNAKRMKFYLFNDERAMVFSIWHKDGICSVYNAGRYVNFDYTSNMFKDGDWLYADGRISKSESSVQNMSSKGLSAYKNMNFEKAVDRKDTKYIAEELAVAGFFKKTIEGLKTMILDDFCR